MGTVEENLLKSDNHNPKKKTFRDKLEYIGENITIEPILVCYVTSVSLSRLATQNLNLDKACRVNMQYGDSVCDALIARKGDKYLKQELVVQEMIAGMESWKNVLLTAIPCFLILFLGAWSDRTGKRKMCIILPIIGELFMSLSNILNAYYFYELPVQVTMFLEAFFPAITGGWITTYMGAFSYISGVSSEESRTFRVGVASLCLTAGGPIGSALSGFLLDRIGYYGVFSLSSLLYLISIIYGLLSVKDPERRMESNFEKDASNKQSSFLRSFFDIKHVKDTLTVTFKKGPDHRRLKFVFILASIALIYGPLYGEFTVQYLFTRYRFNWDALKYSFYSTFFISVHGIGWCPNLPISLFSRRLKWHDSVLGLISTISKVFGALICGFARNSLEFYIAVAVELLNATSFTALRSISSKLVTSDELGKMTSFYNLLELLSSMVFAPIYSWLYIWTLHIYPGTFYFFSTVLTIPPIFFFSWFYMEHKKKEARIKSERVIMQEQCMNELEFEKINKEEPLLRNIDIDQKN